MGWFVDSPEAQGHEGYLVAIVPVEGHESMTRELRYPSDDAPVSNVWRIAVACDCGWRSPECDAPFGTRWAPFSVILPEFYEELYEEHARSIWRHHVDALLGLRMGPATLRELAERLRTTKGKGT